MKLDYARIDMIQKAWEREEQFERESELVEKIDRTISRFNEDELKLVWKYVIGVYQISEACKVDKLIEEAKKKNAS